MVNLQCPFHIPYRMYKYLEIQQPFLWFFASVRKNSGQTPLLSHISCNSGPLLYEIIYTPKFQNLFSTLCSGFYLSNKFLNLQYLQPTC
jgi:hypothetical protein